MSGAFRSFWERLGASWNLWDLLGTSGNLWKLLGAPGNLWEVPGASGNFWEPLGALETSGGHCGPPGVRGSFWKSPKGSGSFCEPLRASGNLWEFLVASGKLCLLTQGSFWEILASIWGNPGRFWETGSFSPSSPLLGEAQMLCWLAYGDHATLKKGTSPPGLLILDALLASISRSCASEKRNMTP